jgi:hypothetical protein
MGTVKRVQKRAGVTSLDGKGKLRGKRTLKAGANDVLYETVTLTLARRSILRSLPSPSGDASRWTSSRGPKARKPASRLASERHGPGGPAGLQNR